MITQEPAFHSLLWYFYFVDGFFGNYIDLVWFLLVHERFGRMHFAVAKTESGSGFDTGIQSSPHGL